MLVIWKYRKHPRYSDNNFWSFGRTPTIVQCALLSIKNHHEARGKKLLQTTYHVCIKCNPTLHKYIFSCFQQSKYKRESSSSSVHAGLGRKKTAKRGKEAAIQSQTNIWFEYFSRRLKKLEEIERRVVERRSEEEKIRAIACTISLDMENLVEWFGLKSCGLGGIVGRRPNNLNISHSQMYHIPRDKFTCIGGWYDGCWTFISNWNAVTSSLYVNSIQNKL